MSKESAVSAIERGDLSELCHVLEESEWDIRSETLDSKGQSALHIACTSGHLDIVEYLVIEKKCSVTVEDVYGHTPLLLSLIHKHWQIAEFLLQNTPISTFQEQLLVVPIFMESTVAKVAEEALHESLKKKHLALSGFLQTLLFPEVVQAINDKVEKARSKGDLWHVKYLLKDNRYTIPDDMPDIHVACIGGNMEKVKSDLDSNGQSILRTTDRYGTAAIHYAAYEPNILNMIMHKGGEVFNLSDKRGSTVLHHSVMSECVDSVELVIGVPECNVNQLNDEGDTPLHVACKLSNTAAVQLCVANERCDLNIHNRKGDTALHIAASIESNGIKMVNCLLRSGKCDLNQINSKHETPLHVACKHGHAGVVEMLVADERCDPFFQDINGDTALYAAVCTETQKDMIVHLLLCRCDLTDKGMRCMNELDLNFVFSGITAMLEMSDYHVFIKERKDTWITLRKGASLNTFKMLLHHIANCNSLCSNSLLLQIPNPLLNEHTDTSYTSYITVNLRVQIKTSPSNKKHKTLVVEYKGIDGCLSYNSDQETLLHAACQSGYSAMAAALLENGADVKTVDIYGNNACHIACYNLQLNCLRLLGEYLNQLYADGDTVFHILCGMEISKEKLLECVKFLRETQKQDINKINKKGETPLHIACTWSSGDVVGALVEVECDVNACDGLGNTALHIAVCSGRDKLQKVQCLLESDKCNPNVRNKHGHTPLHAACRRENIEVLEILVFDQRCDVNIQDDNGNTALHTALSISSVMQCRKVQLLLKRSTCHLNLKNNFGSTPLHIASVNNNTIISVLVADKRCDINIQDKNGNTALHRGVNNAEIVKCLIKKYHARCDIYNQKGLTPFHKAIVIGYLASVEVFLKNEMDIQQRDKNGNAPIHIACQHSRLGILKTILGYEKCDPNQQNANGDTALHIVSRMTLSPETKLQCLKLLFSTPGINPEVLNNQHFTPFEATDKDGNTLLHNACAEGESEMVQLLIENGADVLRPDRRGNAPIHIACMNFRLDILRIILSCKCCNPNQQNKDGDTALHIVCRMRIGNELEYLQSLLFAQGVDFQQSDRNENAPIHIACQYSTLNILKEILGHKTCDPNQQNADGDTALHIVSRMTLSLDTKLQYLQLLLSTSGIMPEVLNNEHLAPFETSDKDGNSVLHIACIEGKSEMVQLLIENGADVLRPDRHGNAPIHIACMNFRLDILRILLNSKHCDPNQQNGDGDTALHIVCRMKIGNELEYLKLLLSVPGINPDIANHAGHTLIEVAGTNYAIIDALKQFLKPKRSSIQAYLKLFVVGNSGAGKSTLIKAVTIEASQLLKYSPFPKMKYVDPRDVSPHTAGIVPIPFKSKNFGNAVLYDFAGQYEYYSSHAAVMENLILPSPPLFLLLVDISKPMEEIKEELHYWWHFIDNQAQKATVPPHVLLGGSHKDIVKQRGRHQLHTIRPEIEDYINDIPVSFMFAGYFPLDCRRLSSQGLTKLLTQLQITCKVLREAVDINLHCHILKAFLTTPAFQDKAYCQIIDIVDRIETSDSYLPQRSLEIIPLLKALNDQGHILLLKNHTDEDQSWVILKPEVLLTDVNGSIFAPENFQKRSIDFAMSTGVVTLSTLKEKFLKYNHEVIIAYLIHLEFCFRIKDQHTLDMITNNQVLRTQSTDDQEQYYFFPALVSVENPQYMYQQNESITFECGWYYKCGQKAEQLTTRFLHVLILRLAFACEPTDNPAEAESVVLLRRCSVWKHGIAWLNNHDIETIVEVGLQCRWVAVMMRCPDNEMVQCAELRTKVIKTVLKTRKDFCPVITMKEFLIHPSNLQYPFEGRELTLYSMREIAKIIVEGKPKAMDTMGKNLISIPELLPFEPYLCMHHLIERFFVGDTSPAVTADDMERLEIKCRDTLTDLKKAFGQEISAFQMECTRDERTEVESCKTLFRILQRRGFKTWKHFEKGFSRFSIFCGRNPIVSMVRQIQ